MESPYKKFAVVLSINAVVMFLLTYALIDTPDHFYANINRAYMALIMVAPMAMVMLFVMRSMYPDKSLNAGLYVLFAAILIGSFSLARAQVPIGNQQFLMSMIPHHSSAIVMCEHSAIDDPQIEKLCVQIVKAQKEEIAEMKTILARY